MNLNFDHTAAALISFIPALINLSIFIKVFFFLPRKQLNIVFALFVFGLFVFQMNDTCLRVSADAQMARSTFIALGSWIYTTIPFGLYFTLLFTKRKNTTLSQSLLFFIFFPSIILSAMHMLGADSFVVVRDEFWGFIPKEQQTLFNNVSGIWVGIQALVMLTIPIIYAVQIKRKKVESIRFKQATLIAGGFIVPVLQGVTTEIIFPLALNINPVPLTTLSVSIFSLCVFIALTKYELLSYSPEVVSSDILDKTNDGIMIVSKDNTIQFVNKKLCHITGYTAKDLRGKNACEMFFDKDHKLTPSKEMSGDKPFPDKMEMEIKRKDGTYCWVEFTSVPYILDGEIIGSIEIINDVTQTKVIEKMLGHSEEKFQRMFNLSNDGLILRDAVGNILEVNERMCKMLKYPRKELLQKNIAEIVTAESADFIRKSMSHLNNKLQYSNLELNMETSKGNAVPVELSASTFELEGQRFVLGALRDITLRKELENKTLQSAHKAQKNERERIARELHDGLGQLLAGLKINLDIVKRKENIENPHFKKSQDLIKKIITETRSISHNLMPADLGEHGLVGAIQKMKERLEDTHGLSVEFNKPNDEIELTESLEFHLYRITQEFVNNTLKYARANNIQVNLTRSTKELVLELEDDGQGFDTSVNGHAGIGLKNMIARTEAIKGSIDIQSFPGKGVHTTIKVPLLKMRVNKINKVA